MKQLIAACAATFIFCFLLFSNLQAQTDSINLQVVTKIPEPIWTPRFTEKDLVKAGMSPKEARLIYPEIKNLWLMWKNKEFTTNVKVKVPGLDSIFNRLNALEKNVAKQDSVDKVQNRRLDVLEARATYDEILIGLLLEWYAALQSEVNELRNPLAYFNFGAHYAPVWDNGFWYKSVTGGAFGVRLGIEPNRSRLISPYVRLQADYSVKGPQCDCWFQEGVNQQGVFNPDLFTLGFGVSGNYKVNDQITVFAEIGLEGARAGRTNTKGQGLDLGLGAQTNLGSGSLALEASYILPVVNKVIDPFDVPAQHGYKSVNLPTGGDYRSFYTQLSYQSNNHWGAYLFFAKKGWELNPQNTNPSDPDSRYPEVQIGQLGVGLNLRF